MLPAFAKVLFSFLSDLLHVDSHPALGQCERNASWAIVKDDVLNLRPEHFCSDCDHFARRGVLTALFSRLFVPDTSTAQKEFYGSFKPQNKKTLGQSLAGCMDASVHSRRFRKLSEGLCLSSSTLNLKTLYLQKPFSLL
ncbi:hypothetical protein D9C73_015222 [Collichthys lucidus]|uniref:Uncharacterized protein n=1 Tax=Collichthys lucidus TaxID=240159 RepID=A0A4U5V164_COLLU|nr:hypothetical protein D9C73_015222 [Collichthys lucidus]